MNHLVKRSSDPLNCDHPVIESSASDSSPPLLTWRCTDCKTRVTIRGEAEPAASVREGDS